eukprot:scaffold1764_cov318-Pavlova_lutheri.AAC.2
MNLRGTVPGSPHLDTVYKRKSAPMSRDSLSSIDRGIKPIAASIRRRNLSRIPSGLDQSQARTKGGIGDSKSTRLGGTKGGTLICFLPPIFYKCGVETSSARRASNHGTTPIRSRKTSDDSHTSMK